MVEQTTAAHGMESGPPTRKGSEKELIGTDHMAEGRASACPGHAEACPYKSGDPINLASVYWLERCRREGTSYTSESHFNIHNALTALNVHGAANTYAGITPPMKTAAKVRSRFRFRSHNHVGFQPGTEVQPDTGRLET